MYREVNSCRICGNAELQPVLNLGNQHLTGIFPKNKEQKITSGPLSIVKCAEDGSGSTCGLLQLKHSYDLSEMYGLNYGYRSGLNQSMVDHLHAKVAKIEANYGLKDGDLIIDIGSNDSTLLQGYSAGKYQLVGIDPTGVKFREYYPETIHLIPEFFSALAIKNGYGNKKAKIITSISMFYDLESPMEFMREVHETLDENGVWVFEQSYMPTMLAMNAYDTICHEHLSYYALQQIKWTTDRVGFKIIDVEFNAVNGGSFSIAVAKKNSSYNENVSLIADILHKEAAIGLSGLEPYKKFAQQVYRHRDEFIEFTNNVKQEGKTMFGYGASTKGNVILQFCNITTDEIPFIAEVNQDKFGCYAPGTLIPIISEQEARSMKPDYFLVLPWHFKEGIIKREEAFLRGGGALVMPLPEIEVIRM